jgi:hypothetical protein
MRKKPIVLFLDPSWNAPPEGEGGKSHEQWAHGRFGDRFDLFPVRHFTAEAIAEQKLGVFVTSEDPQGENHGAYIDPDALPQDRVRLVISEFKFPDKLSFYKLYYILRRSALYRVPVVVVTDAELTDKQRTLLFHHGVERLFDWHTASEQKEFVQTAMKLASRKPGKQTAPPKPWWLFWKRDQEKKYFSMLWQGDVFQWEGVPCMKLPEDGVAVKGDPVNAISLLQSELFHVPSQTKVEVLPHLRREMDRWRRKP